MAKTRKFSPRLLGGPAYENPQGPTFDTVADALQWLRDRGVNESPFDAGRIANLESGVAAAAYIGPHRFAEITSFLA